MAVTTWATRAILAVMPRTATTLPVHLFLRLEGKALNTGIVLQFLAHILLVRWVNILTLIMPCLRVILNFVLRYEV